MSWLDGFRHRLYVRLHPDRYARERAEELGFHGEMESRRGGGVRGGGDAPEDPREVPGPLAALVDRLRQDVGFALRGIVRAPGFAAMVVVTLSLGVGANAAVFSLLDRVFGQAPTGVRDPGGLRRLYIQLPAHPVEPGAVIPSFNWPAFSAVSEATGAAGELVAWTPSTNRVLGHGDAELAVRSSFVTHDYFSVLGVGTAHGRLFGAEEAPVDVPAPVAVISHGLWERAFGLDPGVLGRTLELDSARFTVVGVAAKGFSGLDLSRTDVFFPLSTFTGQSPERDLPWYEGTGNFLRVAARPGAGREEGSLVAAGTEAYRHRQVLPGGRQPDPTALVLTGSIIEARGPARRDPSISVATRVAGVSAMVLLIACANVAGLLLVHASRRRREIAVRLALGVSRGRLLSQLLAESLLLAALAGVGAAVLAVWGGEVLRSLLLPAVDWAQPAVEPRTLAFTLATAAMVGLFAGLAPGLHAWRVDVNAALKAGVREGMAPRSPARSAPLAFQAALSVVLLAGAGLFVRSLENVRALPIGYDVEELAFAWLPLGVAPLPDQWLAMSEAAARISATPGVLDVALAVHAPMRGGSMTVLFLPGRDSLPRVGPMQGPQFNSVSPGFFGVTGLRVMTGRTFEPGEPGVVVVNETMARTFWPGENPLGQCLLIRDPEGPCTRVVGVVQDTRRFTVIEEPTLQYFLPLGEDVTPRAVVIRLEGRNWEGVAAVARAEMERHFGRRTARIERMSEALDPQLRPWRLGAHLFTAFGALALLVTVVGVYSVLAYAVSQRTHEMGVRVALGARLGDVIRLVVGEGLRVVAAGALLGILVALALGRLVESLLYGVTPRDPAVMVGAAAVLLVCGALASLVPAWRAGRVDPVRALAAE